MTVALLILCGALGAVLRYEIAGWIQARASSTFPWGTAAVNVAGTVVLAALVAGHAAGAVGDDWLLVLGAGFAGAFTTFSTWMVETTELAARGNRESRSSAAANLAGPLAVALAAAAVILAVR